MHYALVMLNLAAWLHNIDPYAIRFPEWIANLTRGAIDGIRWYGLAYLTAFVVGYMFTRRIVRVGKTTLQTVEVMDFVITVAIGVIFGGRIGYVLFYKPELFTTFLSKPPFWGVLQLNQGGMSSHGGMIGVGLAVWWYSFRSKRKAAQFATASALASPKPTPAVSKKSQAAATPAASPATEPAPTPRAHAFLHLFDFTALAATVGFFFGRIANFINAELIGRACSNDLPWAVKFPQELHDLSYNWMKGGSADPLIALTKAAAHSGIDATQWEAAIKVRDIDFIDKGITQIINTFQAGGSDASVINFVIEPLLTPHHPSQLYAAFTEGLIVFLVLIIVWLKPRKPGIIAALFGILYGVMRIFNEFFRTPDAHIADQEFAALQLTRGQLLSFVMIIPSVMLLVWATKRNTQRMGGLLKSEN